jgi:hemin uptake protein HemP
MNSYEGQIAMNTPTLKLPTGVSLTSQPLGPELPCLRSEDLFGKDREIIIEHAGMHYRLRLTRANKLILTK